MASQSPASPENSERLTRRKLIDPQLKAARWTVVAFDPAKPLATCDRCALVEYPTENGPADYALCVDGKILGIVEAKKLSLGPQNENDEPASVLLERIRAQRAQTAPVKRRAAAPRAPRRARPEKPAPAAPLPLVAEVAAGYTRNIPQAILAHMQPGVEYSRAEITAATGISDAEWTLAIRQLKEEGKVVQTGERRGARYKRGSAK